MSDAFGNRMKMYEAQEAQRRFMPLVPIIARLDGKNFSGFTRGMPKPYYENLSSAMMALTQRLVAETGACIGYTESDEVSLVFYRDTVQSQVFLDRRIHKMVSILASMTTAWFNTEVIGHLDKEYRRRVAMFDCRVWMVPNKVEAANAILWREYDATRNSISSAARAVFSHRQTLNKNGKELQEMLFQKGVNWNDYPSFFKRGSYYQKVKVARKFTAQELERLPAKHAARQNPNLVVERTEVRCLKMPPFGNVTNRVEVIFDGADPLTEHYDDTRE